jgi:hypothetical protein
MKNIFLIFSFLIIVQSFSFPQEKFSFSLQGGVNYIPMKEFSNYINSLPNSNVDEFSFSGDLCIGYQLCDRHYLYTTIEYISSNASFSGGISSFYWVFKTIPLTIGYEYSFNDHPQEWRPIIGFGISYSFFENESEERSDQAGGADRIFRDNGLGFELKFGVIKKIINNLSVIGELKYRYIDDFKLNSSKRPPEVNISGLGFLLGMKIELI